MSIQTSHAINKSLNQSINDPKYNSIQYKPRQINNIDLSPGNSDDEDMGLNRTNDHEE